MELLRVFSSRVKLFQTATFLDIAVSRDFCVFCILETARGKFKEAVVGIKVVHGINKHFRRVSCEKWSRCVKPFLTATFLEIAVSRDFGYSGFWRPLWANSKRP